MDVLYVLVPIAIGFAGLGITAFVWAVCQGDYDDLETPAQKMLLDDELTKD